MVGIEKAKISSVIRSPSHQGRFAPKKNNFVYRELPFPHRPAQKKVQ